MVSRHVSTCRQSCVPRLVVCAALLLGVSACGGTSPFEDLSSAAASIRAAETSTPLPPGSHYDAKPFATQPNAAYERGYFVGVAQSESQCKWYMYWLNGFATNDTTKMTLASKEFDSMRSWSFYTLTDQGTRGVYDSLVQSAALGDASAMQQFVKQNCPGITP
jgi:hypothetical protein